MFLNILNICKIYLSEFYFGLSDLITRIAIQFKKIKIMNWYLQVLKKYAVFSGRARRQEYWMFVLINLIISIILSIIDNIMGLAGPESPYGIISSIYLLFVLIPSIAVGVRRLHDIGKSGWMLLIAFIPLIGAIWLIVLFVKDSDSGENEYGPNPKGVGNNAEEHLVTN